MSQIKELQIKCLHCEKWLRSPIQFGSTEVFHSSTLIGNKVNCPHCKEMTGCNKENVRMIGENEGFVGNQT